MTDAIPDDKKLIERWFDECVAKYDGATAEEGEDKWLS